MRVVNRLALMVLFGTLAASTSTMADQCSMILKGNTQIPPYFLNPFKNRSKTETQWRDQIAIDQVNRQRARELYQNDITFRSSVQGAVKIHNEILEFVAGVGDDPRQMAGKGGTIVHDALDLSRRLRQRVNDAYKVGFLSRYGIEGEPTGLAKQDLYESAYLLESLFAQHADFFESIAAKIKENLRPVQAILNLPRNRQWTWEEAATSWDMLPKGSLSQELADSSILVVREPYVANGQKVIEINILRSRWLRSPVVARKIFYFPNEDIWPASQVELVGDTLHLDMRQGDLHRDFYLELTDGTYEVSDIPADPN